MDETSERLKRAVERGEELLERQRERFSEEGRKAGSIPRQGWETQRRIDDAEHGDD
jgi:hypothetical protein